MALKNATSFIIHIPQVTDPLRAGKKLRAYTRNVKIPMAIATEIIAKGLVEKTGILIPEDAFEPTMIFEALKKRGIHIHEEIVSIKSNNQGAVILSENNRKKMVVPTN